MREEIPLDTNCFAYRPNFLSEEEQRELLSQLIEEIPWEKRMITLFGKTYEQPRRIAWFGEKALRYSGEMFEPAPMPEVVDKLKERIEKESGAKFNSVLVNLYRDGGDSMGKHSDNEPQLGKNPIIASISLGAERKFKIMGRTKEVQTNMKLSGGSLLIMFGQSQKKYMHELPKTKKVNEPRINLTFRNVLY